MERYLTHIGNTTHLYDGLVHKAYLTKLTIPHDSMWHILHALCVVQT
jgi:hypothetical protein